MTNCSRIPDALPSPHESYAAKCFVGRDLELQRIIDRIAVGRQGVPIPKPVIHIWGPPGIGKSWLLHHIEHTCDCHPDDQMGSTPIQSDVVVVRAELSNLENAIEILVGELCIVDSNAISNLKAHSADDIHTQIQHCVAQAKAIVARSILILLFDGAEKLSPEDFLWLEQELICPLACTERVIIIVASRKELKLWQEFKVRQRLDTWELHAFDLETTRKQLARYRDASRALDEIYLYTKGHPYANQLWAATLEEGCLSDDRKLAHLSHVEAELLQDIESESKRAILRVLSTLRKFNVDSTRCILGEFIDPKLVNSSDGDCRDLLNDLEQRGLVSWSRKQRGYIINPVARKILQSSLRMKKPEFHAELHRFAQTMIEQWLGRYQGQETRLFPEILYHCVQQHHDAKLALNRELAILLQTWLTPIHVTAVQLDELLHVIEEDQELETDLGADLYPQFVLQIRQIKVKETPQ